MLDDLNVIFVTLVCLFSSIVTANPTSYPSIAKDLLSTRDLDNSTAQAASFNASRPQRFIELSDEEHHIGFNMHGTWAWPGKMLDIYAFSLYNDHVIFQQAVSNFGDRVLKSRVRDPPYNMKVYFKDVSETKGYLKIIVYGKKQDGWVKRVVKIPVAKPFQRPPPALSDDIDDATDVDDDDWELIDMFDAT